MDICKRKKYWLFIKWDGLSGLYSRLVGLLSNLFIPSFLFTNKRENNIILSICSRLFLFFNLVLPNWTYCWAWTYESIYCKLQWHWVPYVQTSTNVNYIARHFWVWWFLLVLHEVFFFNLIFYVIKTFCMENKMLILEIMLQVATTKTFKYLWYILFNIIYRKIKEITDFIITISGF